MFAQSRLHNLPRFLSVSLAILAGLIVQVLSAPAPAAAAGVATNYFRIEEDWSLVLLDPDAGRVAPQVVAEMSPISDKSLFCNLEINHRRLPQFGTGGLQVQIGQNEQNVSYTSFDTAVFSVAGEAMTWTQYMERNGSALKFGVVKGTSGPWGNLKEANLHVSCADSQTSLDTYRSDYSVSHAAITYGANRVKSLKLTQVRKYRVDKALGVVVCDIELAPRTIWDESLLQ